MTTIHYRVGGTSSWKPLPSDAVLETWAREALLEREYKDSDNGYTEYIEFHHPDGSRTYACASYNAFCMEEDGGQMNEIEVGDAETIRASFGKYAIERHPLGPDRDWLKL